MMNEVDIEVIETVKGYKTKADTPEKMFSAIKWIVDNKQFLYINGVIVDGFTAQHIMMVYNNLKPFTQKKFMAFHITIIADITWKLLKKIQ